MRRMKVLAFSGLYPSRADPQRGIFLKHRLEHLQSAYQIDLRVVAPTPWFPASHRIFGRYARAGCVPGSDFHGPIPITYPRYFTLPKLGPLVAPASIAAAALGGIRRLQRDGFDPDLIDAYYLHPYGVAAVLLGHILKKPVVLTALGSDVSLLPDQLGIGPSIRWAMARADAITVVCHALKQRLLTLGAESRKLHVIEHGVDLAMFQPPSDRAGLRRALGFDGPTLLSVGSLDNNKGHHLAVQAIAQLPGVRLLIVGQGPRRRALEQQIASLHLEARVSVVGQVEQKRLAQLLGACDMLVSCSEREGIANVLLEALACGTPVAATPVWGSPEVVDRPGLGILFRSRTVDSIADGVRQLLSLTLARTAIRSLAERRHCWDLTSNAHYALLKKTVRRSPHARLSPATAELRPIGAS